jgi:hypothetical protein
MRLFIRYIAIPLSLLGTFAIVMNGQVILSMFAMGVVAYLWLVSKKVE